MYILPRWATEDHGDSLVYCSVLYKNKVWFMTYTLTCVSIDITIFSHLPPKSRYYSEKHKIPVKPVYLLFYKWCPGLWGSIRAVCLNFKTEIIANWTSQGVNAKCVLSFFLFNSTWVLPTCTLLSKANQLDKMLILEFSLIFLRVVNVGIETVKH